VPSGTPRENVWFQDRPVASRPLVNGHVNPAWASVSSLFMIGARPRTRERGSVPSHSEKFLMSGYGGGGQAGRMWPAA
jgi:hypothetical protein